MRFGLKKLSLVLLLFFVTYSLVYVINSAFGGYWPKPVVGRHTYADSGLGIPTLFLWQPYYGYSDYRNMTVGGFVFWPGIELDQLWWHRDLDLANPEDEKVIFSTNDATRVKWHPKYTEN